MDSLTVYAGQKEFPLSSDGGGSMRSLEFTLFVAHNTTPTSGRPLPYLRVLKFTIQRHFILEKRPKRAQVARVISVERLEPPPLISHIFAPAAILYYLS